jgi:hypothetical protein
MSFILDALKKSESERQRQSGPALLEMRIVRRSRALPIWAMVVGALLIVSVVVLAWMALRPAAQRAAGALPVAPVAAQPGVNGAGAFAPSAGASTGSAAPVAPATPTAVTANGADTAAATNTANAADAPINPADDAPAIAPVPDTPPAGAHANLQNYAAVSGAMPELRLDLHVYASNPADRYAFINMRKVREGDITPEGVQVRQITREGVVLEYHGAEFLLGRQ